MAWHILGRKLPLCPSVLLPLHTHEMDLAGFWAGSKTRRDWFPTLYSSLPNLIFFCQTDRHILSSSCPSPPSKSVSCTPSSVIYHVILFLSVLPSSQSTLTCMSACRYDRNLFKYPPIPSLAVCDAICIPGAFSRTIPSATHIQLHYHSRPPASNYGTLLCFEVFCLTRRDQGTEVLLGLSVIS